MRFLHSGQSANFASRPESLFCIQARQQAKIAFQESAFFARLVSAGIARDSINYLINYILLLKRECGIVSD
jgi:hypothetical protein